MLPGNADSIQPMPMRPLVAQPICAKPVTATAVAPAATQLVERSEKQCLDDAAEMMFAIGRSLSEETC